MFKPARGSQLNISHPHSRGLAVDYLMNNGMGKQVFDYSRNNNIGIINGASWVPGRDGPELKFTTNDFVDFSITDLVDNTSGTISVLFKVPPDNGNQHTIFSVSAANGNRSEISILLDFRTSPPFQHIFLIFCLKDGVTQWQFLGSIDALDSLIGQYVRVSVAHNGVSPTICLNDTLMSGTLGGVNQGVWFKAIITDATNPANVGGLGLLRINGSAAAPFEGSISDCTVWNTGLVKDQVARHHLDPYAGFKRPSPARFSFISTTPSPPSVNDPYPPNCTITATNEIIGTINPTGMISGTIEAVDTITGEISG